MRKDVLKRISAVALAMTLAIPAVAGTKDAEAAKKAPSLDAKSITLLPEKSAKITISKNSAKKIVKTTWSASNKKAVKLSAKKKTSVKVTSGGAGDMSSKITAKVKYKMGKKTKTKKLTATVNVKWLEITDVNAVKNGTDGTTLICTLNLPTTNINAYDAVPDEGEILYKGEWTTNVANIATVTKTVDGAEPVDATVSKVIYAENRGALIFIELADEVTANTTFDFTLMGFKGCGSKSMLIGSMTVEPIPVTLTPVDWYNQQGAGNISLTLKTDTPFSVFPFEYDVDYTQFLTVTAEDGTVIPVTDVVVATDEVEGDEIVINLDGGAQYKKFTIALKDSFVGYFSGLMGIFDLVNNTIVVDKERVVEAVAD